MVLCAVKLCSHISPSVVDIKPINMSSSASTSVFEDVFMSSIRILSRWLYFDRIWDIHAQEFAVDSLPFSEDLGPSDSGNLASALD